MADRRFACPYCHENTLESSVGATGREQCSALVSRGRTQLRDDDEEAIAIVDEAIQGLDNLMPLGG